VILNVGDRVTIEYAGEVAEITAAQSISRE
jgi:hypothetical protein